MDSHKCPKCGAEYNANISTCADCLIPLDEKLIEPLIEGLKLPNDAKAVPIARGPAGTITSLVNILVEFNIPYRIDEETGHMESTSELSLEMQLMVRESDFDKFHEIIENLKYEEFPEFEQADRSIEAGLCPACGYKITDEKICPECELPLIIEDE
ncbi:MAG: hypothetical protein HN729_00645 [Candidatus Marinimicrobia bacterium]|jgi:predicted Zn-ribbon and HTH transcriptional regulator|nr:hypothetical protein [Candidatus Neomarinimicrobiota bacterium]MBT3633419.1 hypothetical protein [Candidatus Neomarinimicrobiota bacterium]MBT3681562.1 hypothetical protein [Candidatus Neomarinimicrobiota bacterium]MBT3758471.1 hypothetical protein [Candidatus Neomarinimicrobiota bacterium]MBT3894875.1 hypothetical protein [Candidatus Neomarinimicrobiota bacterium]